MKTHTGIYNSLFVNRSPSGRTTIPLTVQDRYRTYVSEMAWVQRIFTEQVTPWAVSPVKHPTDANFRFILRNIGIRTGRANGPMVYDTPAVLLPIKSRVRVVLRADTSNSIT